MEQWSMALHLSTELATPAKLQELGLGPNDFFTYQVQIVIPMAHSDEQGQLCHTF